jgi:hypothetical protein
MNGLNTSIRKTLLKEFSRRRFLKNAFWGAGTLALLGGARLQWQSRSNRSGRIPGSILGASSKWGHLLREGATSIPTEIEYQETVIVGGGVAGLSAAWWLKRNHYESFKLLELEEEVGGNSHSGKNIISSYPWGAHYLPLPGPEAKFCRLLLEDLQVIQGYDSNGLPIYDEYCLCSDPQERLLLQGRWQEGLVPQVGMTSQDRKEYDEFFKLMEFYKAARGKDGKRAFAIPMDFSSQDPEYLKLDQVSMQEFMNSQGWSSRYLHWYVNYCCRDDYGMGHSQVSAWAGIHYFASRNGIGSNADHHTVLTWPEGNGWLVKGLRKRSLDQIQTKSLVCSIDVQKDRVHIDYLNPETGIKKRIQAKQVVFSAPRFIATRVIRNLNDQPPEYIHKLKYMPWMVANVSVRSLPRGNGVPPAWENVSFYSTSMGYVNATHQNLSLFSKETVLTYYLPLDGVGPGNDPKLARKVAQGKSHSEWVELVAADLESIHPGIRNEIMKVDVWIWGHGMVSPSIQFLWSEDRKNMKNSLNERLHFAHSDMSGISIFEEAQYRGVRAAQRVLSALGKSEKDKA